jgi:hypothetical protein
MDRTNTDQKTARDGKLTTEQEALKLQEFVKKLGGVERAKLALDELARLKKSA